MNEKVLSLLSIASLPIELFAAIILYCQPLRHRTRYLLRIAAVIAMILLLALISDLSIDLGAQAKQQHWAQAGWELSGFLISLGYSFLSYLLAVAAACLLCVVSPPEAIYCVTCAYLTQHIAYCLNRMLTPGIVEGDLSSYSPLYFLIYGGVYTGAYLLIARHIATDGGYCTGLSLSLRLTASALAVALVLSAVGQQLQTQSQPLYIVCLLYGIFCCFFVLWGQLSQQRQLTLQHELDVQQQLWLKHKAQYELSSENVNLINRKCHDLKHQVAALKAISDQTQRDRSIQDLEQSVMIYDSIVETGNQILDTVLTEKSLICEARHITLTCVADGECLSFMDAVDLYTIFGNALDNAIECVSQLDDPDRRAISVTVFSRADLVFLQLENFYDGELRFDGDLPATSKPREKGWHGYGLKSIRYTVEKYGGLMDIQSEDGVFLLRVTIPKYQ